MSAKNSIWTVLVVAATAIIFHSCVKQDFKAPDQFTPSAGFSANATIAQLKNRHTISGKLDTILGDTTISGIVVGNDETGNIYKGMYIQDTTGGILINIDKSNMYNEYKLGQKVLVKCKGLVLGDYSGLPQLGTPYLSGAMWQVGRMAEIYMNDHILKDGLPGPVPAPKEIRAFNQIMPQHWNTLVKLYNVSFSDPGEMYSEVTATTSRNITDSMGGIVVVRTSNYAKFSSNIIPMGICNITGIMGHYGSDHQFTIRSLKDVELVSPYMIQEGFASSLGAWAQYSVQGDQYWVQATYSSTTYASMSGYVSGTYNANEDWLISPSLNLDQYTGEKMKFESAMKYGTAGDGTLKLYYSSDYVSGSPASAAWTEITGFNLSTGSFTWTQSGTIDLGNISGSNVHLAFKYKCTTSGVPTWEIDNIIIWRNN